MLITFSASTLILTQKAAIKAHLHDVPLFEFIEQFKLLYPAKP
jgi:hypothetical protein